MINEGYDNLFNILMNRQLLLNPALKNVLTRSTGLIALEFRILGVNKC